jgi:four helix bundle protein
VTQDYHQLEIWNRAMDYTVKIYEFTRSLPAEEKYNLTSQLRRSAASVPLNIAEGTASSTNTEFSRFLSYGYRSLKETITTLELCQRLYPSMNRVSIANLIDEGNQISRMIHGLIQKIGPAESQWRGSPTHNS